MVRGDRGGSLKFKNGEGDVSQEVRGADFNGILGPEKDAQVAQTQTKTRICMDLDRGVRICDLVGTHKTQTNISIICWPWKSSNIVQTVLGSLSTQPVGEG